MRKIIFLVFLTVFTLGASTVFAVKSDKKSSAGNPVIPDKKENKLS
jgi:hypothetical protein